MFPSLITACDFKIEGKPRSGSEQMRVWTPEAQFKRLYRNCPGRENPAQSNLVCRGSPDGDLTFIVPNLPEAAFWPDLAALWFNFQFVRHSSGKWSYQDRTSYQINEDI